MKSMTVCRGPVLGYVGRFYWNEDKRYWFYYETWRVFRTAYGARMALLDMRNRARKGLGVDGLKPGVYRHETNPTG